MKRSPLAGFTLIEMMVVLIILGVLAAIAVPRFLEFYETADDVAVEQQAAELRLQNTLNVAACKLGTEDCVDIVSTGDDACREGLENFLPEVDTSVFSVENIDSDEPRSNWRGMADEANGGLYWVDRFLGDNTEDHPDDDWFDDWNARQPCIITRADS